MRLVRSCLFVIFLAPFLQAQSFTVVSAASYQATLAPDSLASLFGANLAATSVSATLDSNGQLPTQLGGIDVEVDGQLSPLIYVSPLQINFLVPAGTTPGTANVVVRSIDTGSTRTSTMQVQATAPGAFTADASGKGAGSILNAVTYAPGPFLVETQANGGDDKRTRLSVYATGLRYAGNPSHDPTITNVADSVQAAGVDAAGKRYAFVVEYAGAAPGYFGLDQVNLVIPAELDGAGAVSLAITADGRSTNIVTFQVGSLPLDAVKLNGITLSKSAVVGGDTVIATITLNAPARQVGLPVSLRASSPSAQIPLSVTVPAGSASAQVTITTSSVTTAQNVTITAQTNGVTQTAALEIDPANTPQITTFQITPGSVQGGHAASGTITLNGSPAAGAGAIQIASDIGAAEPPASVTVPFGGNSVTFNIPTAAVTAPQLATLTATFGRSTKTAQLNIAPVLQLTLKDDTIVGGNSVNATVTLGEAAPAGGVTLNVQSDNRTIAQPPLTVSVPSGQTSTAFTITTIPVTVSRVVTITVTYAGSTQSVMLTVNPPGTASVSSLVISPDHVTGGSPATGTVTIGAPAPAGGTSVNLLSNAVIAAQVPLFVTIPQGQTSVKFTINTTHVASQQVVTVTASAGGVSRTATLTVQ